MPIEIYEIANLIWDNGSYRVPNSIPTVFEERKVLNDIPSIINREGGSIPLLGGHWNYCYYKGVYYFLKRDRPLNIYEQEQDIKKQRWQYFLVRDHWVNTVLTKRVIVNGDIATWNLDDLLEENLNRTSLIIENPNGLARICLDTTKTTWKTALESEGATKPIDKKFQELVINRTTLELLRKQIELVQRFKRAQKYIYPHRKDLFILGSIRPTYLLSGWKNEVVNRVNEALSNLTKNEKAILAKVNHNPSGGNRLTGHYCFTYEDDSIGSKEDGIQITEIDLSNAKDIKRVDWHDLETIKLDNILNEETGIFSTERREVDEETSIKVFKLCRKCYLGAGWLSRNWAKSPGAQALRLREEGRTELAFLIWLDKIDFFLSWYEGEIQNVKHCTIKAQQTKIRQVTEVSGSLWGYMSHTSLKPITVNAPIDTTARGFYGTNKDTYFKAIQAEEVTYNATPLQRVLSRVVEHVQDACKDEDDEAVWVDDLFIPRILPHIPLKEANDNPKYLWKKFGRWTPGYGVLLFQLERPWEEWRQFEYLGETEKTTLKWYSGIKKNQFLREYSDSYYRDKSNDKKWWRRINDSHTFTQYFYTKNFARFNADLWQLNSLHFLEETTPSKPEGTQWKWNWGNSWNDFFYEGNEYDTVRLLDEKHLKDLDGNKVENPWTLDKYKEFSKYQIEKLDKIFFNNDLELPRPLKKGDYLISSLEYRWDLYDTSIWGDSDDYYSWLKENDWEVKTFNLLWDFFDYSKLGFNNKKDVNLENELGWEDKLKPQFLIVGDLDGKVSFKHCWTFQHQHDLTDDSEQWVQTVNNKTSETIKYYHLTDSKVALDVDAEHFDTSSLLASFYSSVGDIPVRQGHNSTTFYWANITVDTLDRPEGNLFDLVGTDWCVFIRGKYTHFIYKKSISDKIKTIKQDVKSFKFPDNEKDKTLFEGTNGINRLSELPLTAKINQVNTLIYKTHPTPIQTRFTFQKDTGSKPWVTIEGVETDDKIEQLNNHYIFKFESDYDYIEEPIVIPKEPLVQRSVGDQITFDQLRLQNLRTTEDYAIQKRKLGLNQEITESTAKRALIDLDVEDTYRRLETHLASFGLVGGAVNAGVRAIAGHFEKHVSPLVNFGVQRAQMAVLQGIVDYSHDPETNLPKLTRGSIPYLTTTSTSLKNDIWHNAVVPEKTRRIEEDKIFKFRDMAFQSYQLDLAHHRKKADNALLLNKLSHQWVKDSVNDVFITKKWIEHHKITDLYMLVKFPTGDQLERLEAYRKEFGIDVDIPNQNVTLMSGMTPNIIRMRNIADNGIKGVSDLWDMQFLKNRLEAGIKIFDVNKTYKKKYDYLDPNLLLPNYVNHEEYEQEIRELQEKVETLENDLTREDAKNYRTINYLLQKVQQDYNDIDKLKGDLNEANDLLDKINKEPDKYPEHTKELYKNVKDALEKQIQKAEQTNSSITVLNKENNQLKIDKGTLEEEISDWSNTYKKLKSDTDKQLANLRQDLNNANDEKRNCQNALQDKTTKLSEAQTEGNRLREQIQQKDTQIKNLKASSNFADEVGRKLSEIGFTDGNKRSRFNALVEAYKTFQEKLEAKQRIEQEKDKQIQALNQKLAEAIVAAAQIGQPDYNKRIDLWNLKDLYAFLNSVDFDTNRLIDKLIQDEYVGINDYQYEKLWPSMSFFKPLYKQLKNFIENNNSMFWRSNTRDDKIANQLLKNIKHIIISIYYRGALERSSGDPRTEKFLEQMRKNVDLSLPVFETKELGAKNIYFPYPHRKETIFHKKMNPTITSSDSFWEHINAVLWAYKNRYWWVSGNYNGFIYPDSDVYYDFLETGGKTLFYIMKKMLETKEIKYTGDINTHGWTIVNGTFPGNYLYNPNQITETISFLNEFYSSYFYAIFIYMNAGEVNNIKKVAFKDIRDMSSKINSFFYKGLLQQFTNKALLREHYNFLVRGIGDEMDVPRGVITPIN